MNENQNSRMFEASAEVGGSLIVVSAQCRSGRLVRLEMVENQAGAILGPSSKLLRESREDMTQEAAITLGERWLADEVASRKAGLGI
jgi:hypothetical protein